MKKSFLSNFLFMLIICFGMSFSCVLADDGLGGSASSSGVGLGGSNSSTGTTGSDAGITAGMGLQGSAGSSGLGLQGSSNANNNYNLGVSGNNAGKINGLGVYIPTSSETGLSDMGIKEILTNFLRWLLAIVGIVAMIGFVIAGIQYISAAGDEKRMEAGKKNMTYSIIGIVVALASLVIIRAIDMALRAQL